VQDDERSRDGQQREQDLNADRHDKRRLPSTGSGAAGELRGGQDDGLTEDEDGDRDDRVAGDEQSRHEQPEQRAGGQAEHGPRRGQRDPPYLVRLVDPREQPEAVECTSGEHPRGGTHTDQDRPGAHRELSSAGPELFPTRDVPASAARALGAVTSGWAPPTA
jgi:hypothetical protein